MISGSSNHWDLSEAGIDLMTGAINAAQAAHAAPVQDKPVLSAPRTEQWKAYDDDDGRKYVRRGGGPAGAGSGAASGARAVAYNAHIKMVQKAVEDNERDAAEAEATARRRRDAVSKLRDKVRHSNMPKATFENLAKAHGLKAEESGDILKNLDKIRRDLAGKKQVKTPEVTAHLTKHFPVKSSAAASPAAASPAVASPTAAATSSDKVEEVD
jgi:hypothetical protein